MQKIVSKLLVFFCASGLQACTCSAQEHNATAKIDRVPDAIGLDVGSEGILARDDVRDTSVPLAEASADGLKLMIGKSDIGLVPGTDFSLEDRFSARAFVDGGWVAARRLVNEAAKSEAGSDKRVSEGGEEREPLGLVKLAAESAAIEKLIRNVDRLIERRWTSRAREMLYTIEPSLHASVADASGGSVAISWMEAYERIRLLERQSDQQIKRLVEFARKRGSVAEAKFKRDWLAQLWMRLLYCSYVEQDQDRFSAEAEIVKSIFGELVFAPKASGWGELSNEQKGESVAKTVEKWQAELDRRIRFIDEQRHKDVSVPLAAYANMIYEYQFEDDRYAPPKILIPGYPPTPLAIGSKRNGDMVFGRRSFQLFGWHGGEAWHWPDAKQVEQLNLNPNWSGPDLNLADETSLGGFAIYKDVIFALIDSRERSSASSDILRDALLVGLKMHKGDSRIDNTPMSARRVLADVMPTASKEKATFKGTPLITGDQLFVMVVDESRGRAYRVACFQLPSLEFSWLSNNLGIEGSVASGLSNVSMLYHDGRVVVANGRGSIAGLQADTGRTVFQVNYSPKAENAYDGGVREHVRTGLVAAGETIVCGASDANTIFAIDYTDGHVHWAIEPEQARRAMQIAGVLGEHLICMGDRIEWINLRTGLPDRVVELSRNAMPLDGQVQMVDESIVWTNGMSIFRYGMQQVDPSQSYAKVSAGELEQWPYASREPLAFGLSKSHLSVVTASSWIIFEAKP